MSIYAIHKQEPKFIFLINYKVMYSSLSYLLPIHFPTIKFYNKNQLTEINLHDYPKYSIVRNPFDRAVSAFYGKCRNSPEKSIKEEKSQLEFCQAQLLGALSLIREEPIIIAPPSKYFSIKDQPKERLLLDENFKTLFSIDFDEYVKCMELILQNENIDGHFQKQFDVFSVPDQNPFFYPSKTFRNTKILKLENISQEWPIICRQLGKQIELITLNATKDKRSSFESFYTEETREMIAKIYKIDFKKLGYSRRF